MFLENLHRVKVDCIGFDFTTLVAFPKVLVSITQSYNFLFQIQGLLLSEDESRL